MQTTAYFFLPLLFIILYTSIYLINKIIPLKLADVNYKSIDGLRGYLAFFVFLHHAWIWNFYLKGEDWKQPESNLFNHFGQTSVAVFFMITSFLFTTRLIEHKNKDFNWKSFFISRFYRTAPMYLFSVTLFLAIVMFVSNFKLRDSLSNIVLAATEWIFFSISGTPDINNLKDSFIINAGVVWSLPFEWMFYLMLPIISLVFRIKTSKKIMIISSLVLIIVILLNVPNIKLFYPFAGGIIAAYSAKNQQMNTLLKKNIFSFLMILSCLITIIFFHSGYKIIPLLLTTFSFTAVACGNSVFGLLDSNLSRKFGQITYSLYLIHGILLFTVFKFLLGFKLSATLSDNSYWILVGCCIFPLLFLCQITYKRIEVWGINLNNKK